MTQPDRLSTARRAAAAGAGVAQEYFRTDVAVETKDGPTDVVTRADREAQSAVFEAIGEHYPSEPLVGEEAGAAGTVPSDGPAWIVDPIDGTNNYVAGRRAWATSVAAVENGAPVAAATICPALGDTYLAGQAETRRNDHPVSVSDRSDLARATVAPTIWWPRDRRDEYAAATSAIVRRFGDLVRPRCAQITLASVAAGALDGAFTNRTPHAWDSVAGAHLVVQAGGQVTDLAGDPWRHDADGLVASNGACHEAVLAAAREVEQG